MTPSGAVPVPPKYGISRLASLPTTLNDVSNGVVMDSAGNLYGTTNNGGANKDGSVFEWSKSTGLLTTLASFDKSGGRTTPTAEYPLTPLATSMERRPTAVPPQAAACLNWPEAPALSRPWQLLTAPTERLPGPASSLIRREISMERPSKAAPTTTERYSRSLRAAAPLRRWSMQMRTTAARFPALAMDSTGNLYGTAYYGVGHDGSIFEVVKDSGVITNLASFNAAGSVDPTALILDSAGNLYGTTGLSGTSGDGMVFEVVQGSGVITTLASFNGTGGAPGLTRDGLKRESLHATGMGGDTTGAIPLNLVENQYGGTFINNYVYGDGTLFEIPAGSGDIVTLAAFNASNWTFPTGALTLRFQRQYLWHNEPRRRQQRQRLFRGVARSSTRIYRATFNCRVWRHAQSVRCRKHSRSHGDLVAGDNTSTVTLTIASGPTNAVLGGTISQTVVNGVATFSNLSLPTPGTYTLLATDGTLIGATSASFKITLPSPAVPKFGAIALLNQITIGSKFEGLVPIVVNNPGGAVQRNITVNLYADAGTSLDGRQVLVATMKKGVSLRTGESQIIDFKIKSFPKSISTGSYHLLAETVSGSSYATSVTATSMMINVVSPVVQPTVSVGAVMPVEDCTWKIRLSPRDRHKQWQHRRPRHRYHAYPSTDGLFPVADVIIEKFHSDVKIQPKQSEEFRLHFEITASVAAGHYFPYVSVLWTMNRSRRLERRLLSSFDGIA